MRANSSTRSLCGKLILSGCLVALSHSITPAAFGQNTDIKAELRQRFQDKIFLIQGWYEDKSITYDSSGAVIGTPKRGSWTASAVKINSIKIRSNEIVLKGNRGGFAYDPKANKFVTLLAKEKPEVTITVQAHPATLTSGDLDTLEHAIFAQNAKTDDMPEYWREFMARRDQDPKKEHADAGSTGSDVVQGLRSNSQPVFRVGPQVSPPRILSQHEPEFTEVARGAHYQGNVVVRGVIDDQGVPTQLKIMKALGMGLDDAAVNCVEQWRFTPAKRDNKPVAVTVDIEVNFRLY